jgi:hypothetical protein
MSIDPTTAVTIYSRLFDADRLDLTVEAARSLLSISFEESDRERIHELAVKNQSGDLNSDEQTELATYLHVGCVIDLLHAKARLAMRKVVEAR